MLKTRSIAWVLFLVLGWAAACGTRSQPVSRPASEPATPADEPVEAAEPPVEPEVAPGGFARIGVILPRSGSPVLERYAEYVLEGVRLAVDEHARGRVELVLLDDAGDATRADSLLGLLEAQGVSGIIGPLRPEAVAVAARARRTPELAIISPTAAQLPDAPNVYALNAGDTEGAEALARHALQAGMRRVAMLYPRTAEFARKARAFGRVFAQGGGEVVADESYAVGTTTFRPQMDVLFAAQPEAVFVPAPERDVLQIAPQLAYYAYIGAVEDTATAVKAAEPAEVPEAKDTTALEESIEVQVLGGEAWASEAVRAQVDAQYLEGVVSAVPLYRDSPAVGWRDFVRRYENRYRRSLDNALPALGHDAALLVLAALEGSGGRADAVVDRLRTLDGLRGATGVLGIRNGVVVRRPFLVRIVRGEVMALEPTEEIKATSSPEDGWRSY